MAANPRPYFRASSPLDWPRPARCGSPLGVYRIGEWRRELGVRSGPYTGGAVLLRWHRIPLAVRAKLRAAHPLASERGRAKPSLMLAAAILSAVALVVLSGAGFGQLGDPRVIAPDWLAAAYALLLSGILVPSLWLVRRALTRGGWLPWERFVLPLDAVEVHRDGLIVRPFGDVRHLEIDERKGVMRLDYVDSTSFQLAIKPGAERLLEIRMEAAHACLVRTSLSSDATERDTVDPFATLRDARGFVSAERAPTQDVKRTAPTFAVPIAIVVACALVSAPLLWLRNRWSDEAAFAFARSRDLAGDYKDYLAQPLAHETIVRRELLPRAELDRAESLDTVYAYEFYLQQYPGSLYDAEARSALERAARAEVKRIDSMTDLNAYVEEHPSLVPLESSLAAGLCARARVRIRAAVAFPPLRDALLDAVDRAERSHTPIPIAVTTSEDGTLSPGHDARFTRNDVLDVLEPLSGSTVEREWTHDPNNLSLSIQAVPVSCPAGFAPSPTASVFRLEVVTGGRARAWSVAESTTDQRASLITVLLKANDDGGDPRRVCNPPSKR